ncbi:MAG: diguanylate cyclase [Polyangiales bacterium]
MLAQLMRASALSHGDIATGLPELCATTSALLEVERVSVWQLGVDGAPLECVARFVRSDGEAAPEPAHGTQLAVEILSQFSELLHEVRVLTVDDAAHDARVSRLFAAYLAPARVAALMVTKVALRGRLVGFVLMEHVGARRAWELWEELVAGTAGDFVAQLLLAREQVRLDALLKQLRARVDETLERRTSQVVRENADLQREVDALQLAAEAIRKSEDDLRKLFAASPVAMLLVRRADERVLLANEVSAGALRADVDALQGKNVNALFAYRSDMLDLFGALARGDGQEAREVQLRTQDGELFWALLSARSVVFGNLETVMLGFTDLTAQKAVEHQLRYLAQRDPLTQAYNRHHFWQLAAGEMARVRRYRRPLSVAMIDADHFKNVNDVHGHDVGDLVLRFIVDTCHESLRKNDVLARYGGEEFVVLLPETAVDGAQVVFERLRERIAGTPLQLGDGKSVSITVSVGLAGLSDYEEGFEELLKRADDALYVAKRGGRNRVQVG